MIPPDDMEVQVSLATTGETVYTSTYAEVNDLRVWELRLYFCHELACTKLHFCHELACTK